MVNITLESLYKDYSLLCYDRVDLKVIEKMRKRVGNNGS